MPSAVQKFKDRFGWELSTFREKTLSSERDSRTSLGVCNTRSSSSSIPAISSCSRICASRSSVSLTDWPKQSRITFMAARYGSELYEAIVIRETPVPDVQLASPPLQRPRFQSFQTFQAAAVQSSTFHVRFKVRFGGGNFHVSGILETSKCVQKTPHRITVRYIDGPRLESRTGPHRRRI
jgi:hypothetical protein